MSDTTTPEVTTVEPYAYLLTPGEYLATIEKIGAINARATKRGFTGRLTVEGVREDKTSLDTLTQVSVTEVFYRVTITGTAPSYNGWSFLARADRVGDTFTVATAPGVDHVDRSLVRPGECDHCGHDRRRNNTYLVVNDTTGQVVNVGSTCIKDFLGWTGSVVFLSNDDVDRQVRDSFSSYVVREWSVDTALTYAVAAIRTLGFVRTSDFGISTAAVVQVGLNGAHNKSDRDMLAQIAPAVEEATALVESIKAFILSEDFNGTSTYVDNLKALVAGGSVTGRQIGLIASAPQAYFRHNEKRAEQKAAAAKTEGSQFVGSVKDKVTVTGTIEMIRYSSNAYGTTTIYKILGQDGNLFTWFSSNGALGDTEGVAVTLTGTVKGHEEYRGVKTTVLTRCKAH